MKEELLIIDDDPSMRALLEFILTRDYFVKVSSSAKSALSWIHQGNIPNLIITDARMPQMSGSELITYLKSSLLLRTIPIIVLSALEKSQERLAFYENGADEVLSKPFDPALLDNRVKYLLNKQ